MHIEAFHSQDVMEVVDVWNRNLPADPISPGRLEARVLLDPSFRETHFLVARDGDGIAGFVLGICGKDSASTRSGLLRKGRGRGPGSWRWRGRVRGGDKAWGRRCCAS